MKKLFYIANIRFPTERAHGIQVAHMCSAFGNFQLPTLDFQTPSAKTSASLEVTLLVPDRKTIAEDPYTYYGVERNFTIEKIPVPDTVRFCRVGFFIESLVFAWRAARRIQTAVDIRCPQLLWTPDVYIYTREELPLLFLPRGSAFYEAHQMRKSFLFHGLIRRARGIIAITQGLKDALVRSGISESRVLVAPDGYDEQQFAERPPNTEARRRLGLPQDRRIALYIGGLEDWKGAETLCKAAKSLSENGILTAIIGGTESEVTRFQRSYPEVLFLGARPYREMPEHQQAADVLVVPNSARKEISHSFTSPLKLFAHMASGAPIVASRLPSLTEVLSEENAYLAEPDNPTALAEAIRHAVQHPADSAIKARRAAEEAHAYSWDKRAGRVLAYLQCQNERKSS